MSDPISTELLEQLHSFPGSFVIKVIGRAEDDFVSRVLAAVREELAIDFDPPHAVRETPGGRHVSVSIEPWVESPQQVVALFTRIRTVTGLVMLM